MDWDKLDKDIARSPRYLFFKKYQRLFIFIQGFIVIGLLFGIIMYTLQDRQIKLQIRDNCGYTTDTYDCVCEPNIVENWKTMKYGGKINLNFTNESNG